MDNMVRNEYGVCESNPLPEGFHDEDCVAIVPWDYAELAKVTRFRLISDPGFPMWDVSYCIGRLRNGDKVYVQLPFGQLSKRRWKTDLIHYAKADGVYAKRLGFFNADVVSALI